MLDPERIKAVPGRQSSSRKTDADKALDAFARSSRIGSKGGRPAMPFHCHIGSAKVGAGVGAIDYLAREGDYDDRTDLEHLAGDPEAVRRAGEEIDAGVRIRNGENAERIFITIVHELPATSTPAVRRDVAEALVERYGERGHEGVAAVHMPAPKPDGRTNPHIHVAVAARPWKVDLEMQLSGPIEVRSRDRSVRLMVGKAAVQAERKAVADLINATMAAHGIDAPEFVPGKLASVGIDRKPRKRVPEAAYHRGQLDPDPASIAAAWERHLAAKAEAEERRREKERDRQRRLRQRGLVERSSWDALDLQYTDEMLSRRRAERERDQARRELAAAPKPLTDVQREVLEDIHALQDRPLPDLTTSEGLSQAWAFARQELKKVRAAEEAPPEAARAPQARSEVPEPPPAPVPPQRPPAGSQSTPTAFPPFRVKPGQESDARRQVEQMPTPEVRGRLKATRAALAGDKGDMDLKTGSQILLRVVNERGLKAPAPAPGRPSGGITQ